MPHPILCLPIIHNAATWQQGGRRQKLIACQLLSEVERLLIPWVMSHLCVGLPSISVRWVSSQGIGYMPTTGFLSFVDLLCFSFSPSLRPPPSFPLPPSPPHSPNLRLSHVHMCTYTCIYMHTVGHNRCFINVCWTKIMEASVGNHPSHFLDKVLRHCMWVCPDGAHS